MTIEEKTSQLLKIAERVAATNGGPLAAPGVNPVFGEGNPGAKIMFIGEAPGFFENEKRRPFVGKSGQLLRRIMRESGFVEDEVYITNIVKFRPPENRDPLPDEIEFFRPFLDEQISVIGPEIIVTLGRFSMYKFFGEIAGISRIHGQARKVSFGSREILVFPMFHPAAALRDGGVMRSFVEDFGKLRALLDKIQPSEKIKSTENGNGETSVPDNKQLGLI